MANRPIPVDAIFAQAQRLVGTNQPYQALDLLLDYFAKPRIKGWDPVHDRMAQLALDLSADLSRPAQNVIKRYAQYSVDYALDTLPTTIKSYVKKCYSHIENEEARATQEQNNCRSPLLKTVDLPHLLKNSIVRPAIEFMNGVFLTILTELRDKTRRYDALYHKIMEKAFKFSAKFSNLEYLSKFSNELYNYANTNEVKAINAIPFINSQYNRYEAASLLDSCENSLYALVDANKAINKNSVPSYVVEKIEKAKYDLLKRTGYKLYAAIQHINLFDLYRRNKDLKPEIPLEQMHEIVLVEVVTAPLVEEATYLSNKINLGRFLDQAGGNIPSRGILVRRLLENATKSALSEFVISAEFGTDPFAICDKFLSFKSTFNKQPYYSVFEKDLENYAAIRAIEKTCFHYKTIHFDELSEMIAWLNAEQIEELIVSASRVDIIPGHINQKGKYIELIPRGEQCLQPSLSHLNDKLRDIFDHFQRIKKNLPPQLATRVMSSNSSNVSQNRSIYSRPEDFENRKKELKERVAKANAEMARRREDAARKEAERQREREQEEIALREREKKNKEERDRREQEYNFAYTEIKIIADEIGVDLEEFLQQEKQEDEPVHNDKSKSEDLDWIKYKSSQIKIQYVKLMRSQSDIVQDKMNQVKQERGRQRVLERLAFRQKFAVAPVDEKGSKRIDKEPEAIMKCIKKHKSILQKNYEEDAKTYTTTKEKCLAAKESFEALQAEVLHRQEEEYKVTHKVQPPPPGNYQRQPMPRKQPEPSDAEKPAKKEEEVPEKNQDEEEPQEASQETPKGEAENKKYVPTFSHRQQQPQPPMQQQQPQPPTPQQPQPPTTGGAYKPVTSMYKPPVIGAAQQQPQPQPQPQPTQTSSAYKPPTTNKFVPQTGGQARPPPQQQPPQGKPGFSGFSNRGGSGDNYGNRGGHDFGGRGGHDFGGRGGHDFGGRGGRGGRGGSSGGADDPAARFGSSTKK